MIGTENDDTTGIVTETLILDVTNAAATIEEAMTPLTANPKLMVLFTTKTQRRKKESECRKIPRRAAVTACSWTTF